MIWIGYTTLYRDAGPKFKRAAHTLAEEKRKQNSMVRLERIESKREFVNAMKRVRNDGLALTELHFIGHSGMYGPMFRTTSMPEQFSPHEWSNLQLPFAQNAHAYFHACRSARWFAPFFARTFGVTAHGYHWYTTVSTSPTRFRWEGVFPRKRNQPLYIVACPGKKSHGLAGSLLKYAGRARIESLKQFEPAPIEGDSTYNSVADLYDRAFDDISVRKDEWAWMHEHLPKQKNLRVLDIGCGNGALLRKLSPLIDEGIGVDASKNLVEIAKRRARAYRNLQFHVIQTPELPFDRGSFDVVMSMLSFRYLDWDPIMNEIVRVLARGGRFLMVDMVTAPLRFHEAPAFAHGKIQQVRQHRKHPEFARALRSLVTHPTWQTMLRYNPIRAEHEYRWYFESRFPGRKLKTLNVAWDARVVAFDSGPIFNHWVSPQSYP